MIKINKESILRAAKIDLKVKHLYFYLCTINGREYFSTKLDAETAGGLKEDNTEVTICDETIKIINASKACDAIIKFEKTIQALCAEVDRINVTFFFGVFYDGCITV